MQAMKFSKSEISIYNPSRLLVVPCAALHVRWLEHGSERRCRSRRQRTQYRCSRTQCFPVPLVSPISISASVDIDTSSTPPQTTFEPFEASTAVRTRHCTPHASRPYPITGPKPQRMEEALKQLQQFAANTDDIGRQDLRNRLRRLADSTEDIITTIDRIGHRVRQRIQIPTYTYERN